MTRLIIVRHGQSVANEQKRFAGHSNFDLTPLGRKQAELAGEYIFKNFKADAIYSSDLKRAYHTSLPAAKLFGLEVTKSPDLREIFAGEWETLTFDEILEQYTEDFTLWRTDIGASRCTDGESVAELYDRVCPEFLRIAEENEGKTVLIFTHATPIRMLECMSYGLGVEYASQVKFVKNASINIFEVENGIPRMIEKDIIEHLKALENQPTPF